MSIKNRTFDQKSNTISAQISPLNKIITMEQLSKRESFKGQNATTADYLIDLFYQLEKPYKLYDQPPNTGADKMPLHKNAYPPGMEPVVALSEGNEVWEGRLKIPRILYQVLGTDFSEFESIFSDGIRKPGS